MKAILRPQLSRIAVKAGLKLERWTSGTVRFTLPGAGSPTDITLEWFGPRVSGPVYCIGREQEPPLASIVDKRARARFPLLTRHRVVLLESAAEIKGVTTALRSKGWCVGNDVYLFPSAGGWLAYVGHHHELFAEVSAAQREVSTKLTEPKRVRRAKKLTPAAK